MLTIGDFSRLSRVSPRMLRHYDELGLLRPEAVGENGYRYYRQEQLADLVRIQWLKDYGFPLSDIRELLSIEEPQLLERLREQRILLRRELADQTARLHRLDADILRMEGIDIMENNYHVILLEDPEQKVFSIRKTLSVEQFHDLFNELRREAEARGLKQAGPIQVLYYDQNFDHNRADVEAQMVVVQDGPDVKVKPRYTCACVQHHGPYENLHLAYGAVCTWLAQHPEYRIVAPPMDRYLNDPHQVPPEQLETGILFPVEKVE